MGEPLTLPTLGYPFTVQVSPFAAEVDEDCYRWGARMGIYHLGDPEEYRRIRVGWLAACTTPRGTRTGLQLLADWQMWLFAFDDGYCDESQFGLRPESMVRRVVGLLAVLEGIVPAPDDPFGIALADVRTRLAARAHGFQRARFVAAVTGYLLAQCWEAVNRAAGTPPTLSEYRHMRRHSSAVRSCTALIDVAEDFPLSAGEYDHPEVVALTDLAVEIACSANDIVSYPKEVRRSSVVHSLPVVLGRGQRGGAQRMLDAAARLHDRTVRRYLRAERRTRTWASPSLHRYLDGLRSWMTGNLHWSRITARYDLGSGTVTG